MSDSCQKARHREGGFVTSALASPQLFHGKLESAKLFQLRAWEGLHSPAMCDTEPALLPFHDARARGQILLTRVLSLAFLPLPRA